MVELKAYSDQVATLYANITTAPSNGNVTCLQPGGTWVLLSLGSVVDCVHGSTNQV